MREPAKQPEFFLWLLCELIKKMAALRAQNLKKPAKHPAKFS
jgi:hypothetical protein